jgi:hypothetical protein
VWTSTGLSLAWSGSPAAALRGGDPNRRGTTYSGGAGPNYTIIPAPTAQGWAVVLLTCINWKQFMGAYSYPQE